MEFSSAFVGLPYCNRSDAALTHAHLVARALDESHFNAVAENLTLTLQKGG
jgi:hypothetical protein